MLNTKSRTFMPAVTIVTNAFAICLLIPTAMLRNLRSETWNTNHSVQAPRSTSRLTLSICRGESLILETKRTKSSRHPPAAALAAKARFPRHLCSTAPEAFPKASPKTRLRSLGSTAVEARLNFCEHMQFRCRPSPVIREVNTFYRVQT